MNHNYSTLKVKRSKFDNVEEDVNKLIEDGNIIIDVKMAVVQEYNKICCLILYKEDYHNTKMDEK